MAASTAGRAREEDHPLGLGRDVVVSRDHARLATAVIRRGLGNRGPHSLVQLPPELLDEPLLVLAHGRIALGQEDLSMSGLHTEELHRALPGEDETAADRAAGQMIMSNARHHPNGG